MAQYLKNDIQEALVRAALDEFARKGFRSASVAGIAAAASVSTGNVYRYFESKTALYQAAVPEDFVATFQRLLRQRVEAARGAGSLQRLAPTAPYRVFSEELLAFCIQHRLRVAVLLASCEDTEHEGFAASVVQSLVSSAIAHFHARPAPSSPERFALEELYRNFVGAMERILRRFEHEQDIRAAVEALTRYHLTGLVAFFEE